MNVKGEWMLKEKNNRKNEQMEKFTHHNTGDEKKLTSDTGTNISNNRWSLRAGRRGPRSEEHTSELQSRFDLVCRLLLEKKNLINDHKENNILGLRSLSKYNSENLEKLTDLDYRSLDTKDIAFGK